MTEKAEIAGIAGFANCNSLSSKGGGQVVKGSIEIYIGLLIGALSKQIILKRASLPLVILNKDSHLKHHQNTFAYSISDDASLSYPCLLRGA
jgi:hypothetical protein